MYYALQNPSIQRIGNVYHVFFNRYLLFYIYHYWHEAPKFYARLF